MSRQSRKESNERAKRLERDLEIDPEDRTEFVDTGEEVEESETITHEEVPGSDVSNEELVEDAENPASTMQYNGNLGQNGYSPADRLTTDDVEDLEREWEFHTDSAGLQTNPIVVPGDEGDPPTMYFTQGNMVVQAVNARTGEKYWEYDYATQREHGQGNKNRGVSVYEDKVYFAPHDNYLVALDRYTGEEQWVTDFLTEEQAEMPIGEERVSHTAATLVYDGTVLLGQSGDMIGWTTITGFDAETGDIEWQFKTAPEDEWVGDTWEYSSAAAWMGAAVEPDLGLAYFVTGNPMPVANGVVRPGPNKHSNSIIAVDPESGEIEWTHQLLPHDVWDYDAHQHAHIIDMEVDGEERRVIAHNSKSAWTFFVDAETGELVERSDPWETQEHRFGAYPESEFLNYPPKGEENAGLLAPHYTGATEWPADGWSAQTGFVYVNTNGAQTGYYYTDWEFDPEVAEFLQSGGTTDPGDYDAELRVQAVDPESGEIEWESTFEDADGKVWGPGTRATGGGLVFSGSPEGAFVAFDAENGDQLWDDDTEGRITASPVIWDDPEEEREFVAIASDDRIIVYTTPTSDDAPFVHDDEEGDEGDEDDEEKATDEEKSEEREEREEGEGNADEEDDDKHDAM